MAIAKETALVYCEKQFGLVDGKTAAALVRHSELYEILGVIDSGLAGKEAGEALGGSNQQIPIFFDLADALRQLPTPPQNFIYGKAPLEAHISIGERAVILEAMAQGMNIVNGLHQLFSEDREFVQQAARYNVQLRDVRKPPALEDLHVFSGKVYSINVPVIAILGTDCACGKMTTAVELNQALNQQGIKSVMVATGQTGLMQGAKYGVPMDALVAQFAIGEVEHAVVQAFEQEQPDIILVEGQSAVSHPAFMSSLGILKGSLPHGVILQHPPARKVRCDFPNLAMPQIEDEIQLIEAISSAQVLAITLSHEDLTETEVMAIAQDYEARLHLPTSDVLQEGCQKLIQTLIEHFPALNLKLERDQFDAQLDTRSLLAIAQG